MTAKPSMAPMVATSVLLSICDFGDQFLDDDIDHGPGGKGQGIGQDRPDEDHGRGAHHAGDGLDHAGDLAVPEGSWARDMPFAAQGNGDGGAFGKVLDADAQGQGDGASAARRPGMPAATAPKATPTASPSGMLCKVMARTSRTLRCQLVLMPSASSIGAPRCRWGRILSTPQRKAPPSRKPTVAGTQGGTPDSSAISMAGRQERPEAGGDHDPGGKAQHAVEHLAVDGPEKEDQAGSQRGHEPGETGGQEGLKDRVEIYEPVHERSPSLCGVGGCQLRPDSRQDDPVAGASPRSCWRARLPARCGFCQVNSVEVIIP